MNKPAPFFSAAGLCGGISLCLLALPVGGRAQTPATPDPAAATAEAPGEPAASPPPNDTEILANQGATFSAKDRVAVFTGSVRVNDPRFTLFCDELTVYLSKGAVAAAVPAPTPGPTPPPVEPATKPGEKPDPASRGNGLERAVAKGHVRIYQKRAATKAGEEEKVSVGWSETAEYDGKTGDMTLRGMPKVEQNGDSHEALSRSTYMVMHNDNSLQTFGPSSTHILQRGNTLPGSASPAGSPGKRTPPGAKQG